MKRRLPGGRGVSLWTGSTDLLLHVRSTRTTRQHPGIQGPLISAAPERQEYHPALHLYFSYLRKLAPLPGDGLAGGAGARLTAHTWCYGDAEPTGAGNHYKKRHHISLDHSNGSFCYWECFSVTLIYAKPNLARAIFFTSIFSWEGLMLWSILLNKSLLVLFSGHCFHQKRKIKSSFSQLL